MDSNSSSTELRRAQPRLAYHRNLLVRPSYEPGPLLTCILIQEYADLTGKLLNITGNRGYFSIFWCLLTLPSACNSEQDQYGTSHCAAVIMTQKFPSSSGRCWSAQTDQSFCVVHRPKLALLGNISARLEGMDGSQGEDRAVLPQEASTTAQASLFRGLRGGQIGRARQIQVWRIAIRLDVIALLKYMYVDLFS